MKAANTSINCTKANWIGRAHCESCHIRSFMLFSDLPRMSFERFLEPINTYQYQSGSFIYEAGSSSQYLYSIRTGMVKLEYTSKEGHNRIVRVLGAGNAIGFELLDGVSCYHHNAISMTSVEACKIPVSTIRQLETVYPELSQRIRLQLQQQLDLADQWIYDLSTGTATQRVAKLLLILQQFFSNPKGNFWLLHRDDMSAMINIAADNVSRIIAQFKRNQILVQHKNGLYGCDRELLIPISGKE